MADKKKKNDEDYQEFEEWDKEGVRDEIVEDEVVEKAQPKEETPEIATDPEDVMREDEDALALDTAANIPVTVTAVVGQAKTKVKDLLNYKTGHVIDLHRSPGETVDLIAGGKLIARGELVEIEGRLGVRVLKMLR